MRKRLFLSAVLTEVLTEGKNCLSQNHKLFEYFWLEKVLRKIFAWQGKKGSTKL